MKSKENVVSRAELLLKSKDWQHLLKYRPDKSYFLVVTDKDLKIVALCGNMEEYFSIKSKDVEGLSYSYFSGRSEDNIDYSNYKSVYYTGVAYETTRKLLLRDSGIIDTLIRVEKKDDYLLIYYHVQPATAYQAAKDEFNFTSYIHHSDDMYLLVNPNMCISYGNLKFQKELKSKFGTSIFIPFSDYFKSDYLDQLNKDVESILSGLIQKVKFEAELNFNGAYNWYELHIERFQSNDVFSGILVHLRDNAERKKAESVLLQSEKKFRQIFENFQEIFFVQEGQSDGSFVVTDISPSIFTISGYTPEELIGTTTQRFYIDPADREKLMKELMRNGFLNNYEVRLQHKNGNAVWVTNTSQVYQEDGKILVRGVIRDISANKLAESKLQEQEQFYRSLIENSMEITSIIDKNGYIVFITPAVQQVMGYDPSDLVGKNVFSFIHPEDIASAHEAFTSRVSEGGLGRRLDWRLRDSSGKFRHLGVMINNLLDNPSVNGLIINAVDVTARYEAEKNLLRSNYRFKVLNDINQIIIASATVKQIADGCLKLLVHNLLKCDRGTFVIFNDDGTGELVSTSITYGKSALPKGAKLPYSHFKSFAHIKNGNHFLVHDISKENEKSPTDLELESEGIKSYVCYPLITRGKLVGAINLSSKSAGFFNDYMLDFLGSITGQIALGVQDAFLKEELIQSEAHKSAIISGIPDLIFRIDKKGVFLDCHTLSEEDLYLPKSEFLGKSIREVMPKKLGTMMLEKIGQALITSEMQKFEYELATNSKTGFFEARVSPTATNQVIVVVRNITDQVLSQKDLTVKNTAVETSPDGIFIVDAENGKFIYTNKAFRKITGFDDKDVSKMMFSLSSTRRNNWSKHLFKAGTVPKNSIKKLKTTGIFSGEFLSYKKDKTPFWNFFTMQAVRQNDVITTYIGVVRDITELKNFERKMLNTVVDIQEAERKRIASDLHDGLGQTLTAINMYFGALLESREDERWEEIGATTGELIKRAISETRLISHALMPSTLNKFGLAQAMNELSERHNALNGNLRIMVNTSIDKSRFEANLEITLFRIAQEIINNTIKHSEADYLKLSLDEYPQYVSLITEDNGKGFDKKKLPDSGIGLTNLISRITALNGTIVVDSSPGNGTRIICKIPKVNPFKKTPYEKSTIS